MFNFGNNQWWINQLAQRTKTKNLLPKLHREKSDEENDGGKKPCSVDKTGRLKQSSKLHSVSNINKITWKPQEVLAENIKFTQIWDSKKSPFNLSPFTPLSPIQSFKSLSPPPSIDPLKLEEIRTKSSSCSEKCDIKNHRHEVSMRQ